MRSNGENPVTPLDPAQEPKQFRKYDYRDRIYALDLPNMPRYAHWLLAIAGFISIHSILSGWLGSSDSSLLTDLIVALSIPFAIMLIDFFVKLPIAFMRSLRIPANRARIGYWPSADFIFGLGYRVSKHDARNLLPWIIGYFLALIFVSGNAEDSAPFDWAIPYLMPAFFTWLFILECGIMASVAGRVPYSSIPVFLFWTVPAVAGSIWGSAIWGEQSIMAPLLAHVDTKYVPNYWQASVEGIPARQGEIYCGLMLVGYVATYLVAVVLFHVCIKSRIRSAS